MAPTLATPPVNTDTKPLWPHQGLLSGVEFLRTLTAMILTAGWGCKVTTGRLFVMAQDRTLDIDRQATVRSALWLTLVTHPRAVLEFAAADQGGLARSTLQLAVAENHAQSGLSLKFLEKIADPANPSPIQAVAADVLAPTKVSDRHFVVVAA
ncbi:MAG TPA: hypothetical protein VL860_01330 [Planctomycetota bacterium]|nr:hypothetical protein [Planctomycetota bacterium]